MSQKETGISIIIPVYNSEQYIKRCVYSITNQHYDNKEIILVENGSTDNSLKECEKLEKEFECIKVVKTNVKGVSNARNIGLNMVKKEVVGFCDADDFYEPETLKTINKLYENDAFDILITEYYRVCDYGKEKNTLTCRAQKIRNDKLIEYVIYKDEVLGSVWNKFYKYDVIKDIRFKTDLQFCEDTYFNMEVLNNRNLNCRITDFVGYNYVVVNEHSATNRFDILFDENDDLKYITTFRKIVDQLHLSQVHNLYCRFKMVSFAIEFLYRFRLEKRQKEKLLQVIKDNLAVFVLIGLRIHDRKSLKLIYMLVETCIHHDKEIREIKS